MDADSFAVYINTKHIYTEIAKDVGARFDISNYELGRLLPRRKKRVARLMKDELRGKKLTEFTTLEAKAYRYLIDDDNENIKEKGNKKCAI